MKTKLTIFIASISIFAGAIMGVIGMSRLDWDFTKLDTNRYTERAWTAAETDDITEIRLKSDWHVRVIKGDAVALKYYETDKRTTAVTLMEGVLSVEETRTNRWFNWFDFSFRYAWELTVPDDVKLTVNSTNAKMDVTGVRLNGFSVDSVNADLNVKNSVVGNLLIDSANLDMDFTDVTALDLKVDSANTDLDWSRLTAEAVTIDTVNLNADIRSSTFDSLTTTATNTDLEVEGTSVAQISVKGTNLDVDLSLKGDGAAYTVRVKKINGDAPADRTGTDPDKYVSLDGVNVDASLSFAA